MGHQDQERKNLQSTKPKEETDELFLHHHRFSSKTVTLSSMKVKQPSAGTKAVIFFPFLISCTRAHFRIAELGCFASIPLIKESPESKIE